MRRSTAVVFLLFIVMVGAYYYVNNRANKSVVDVTTTPEPTQAITFLFKAEDGQPTGIRIESKAGKIFEMARNAENVWALKLPIAASAEQGSAEAAASQVSALRITDHLASTVSPKDVGLDSPEYILTIKFNNGVERKAYIGVVTPTESGYYVLLDGENQIVIVSKDAIDPLIGLLTNPPYKETPTATVTPSQTPVPPTLRPATPTP